MTQEEKAKAYDKAIERAKRMFSEKELNYLFPQLKEPEDERIRKEIIDFVKSRLAGFPQCEKYIAWLEKQYSDANKAYWRGYREGKQEVLDKYAELEKQGGIDNCPLECSTDAVMTDSKKNQIEPTFKVGDWVVRGDTIAQILDIQEQYYVGLDINGKDFTSSRFLSDDKIHLWSIEDAKDGDVLSDGTTIFIFKDLLSDGSVMSYCDYDTDSGESDAFCPLSVNLMCSKITPATKEQRDLLFAKMKKSGYEWDADKKELKKIEQKHAWSEEDERIYQSIMDDTVQENQLNDEQTNWLRDIKYRYFQQPKQEWSEENESILQGIWDEILANKHDAKEYEWKTYDKFLSWLKSLRPQNKWKPNDEQMKALHELNLTGNISYAGQGQVLIELYNDLKRLLKTTEGE